MNSIIEGEKETRDLWIERYEKESKDHNTTKALYDNSLSETKQHMLNSKNAEISLQTYKRQCEQLTEQRDKF